MPSVKGDSTNADPGVLGQNTDGGPGVLGETTGVTPATGVQGSASDGRGVTGESQRAEGVLGVSNTGAGVFGNSQGGNGVQGISGSPRTSGVYGENMARGWGAAGRTNSSGPDGAAGVWGDNIGSGVGVLGTSRGHGVAGVRGVNDADPTAIGVAGSSAQGTGVLGTSTGSSGVGVGGVNNAGGNAIGVSGSSASGTGVRGMSAGGTAIHGINLGGLAGRFEGNVVVTGSISKSAGQFLIDHPLDPTNKYLAHSFVESPEMMNIYNGTAVLDGLGTAVVELPAWFDALNRDFRYGLTPIGSPAPNLHLADEIIGNRFRIAGGPPRLKVSWQVTGVRCDPYAQAHPIEVEVDKPPHERGRFLHPDLYPTEQNGDGSSSLPFPVTPVNAEAVPHDG
ncbi:hypothetical protein [Frankia sp. Cppng1_Ct_nod]|uniref:hypothetical protein n=1 Tax=Frankia sp. Cppng1_Ct_nod TaxID=2897162 RepID=UPI0020248489|nr:hypothetical protein [Frankia sp. Cppng1_Ct_nod]